MGCAREGADGHGRGGVANGNKSMAITPTNGHALVAPNTPATIYFNLWNDGLYGLYNFGNTNAQLFVEVLPMERQLITTSGG